MTQQSVTIDRALVEQSVTALDELDDYFARIEGNDRGSCSQINLIRAALKAQPVQYSGADELPPVFGRRWQIALDGFGLQRSAEGPYVHIDDALSVLHEWMEKQQAQPAPKPVLQRRPELPPNNEIEARLGYRLSGFDYDKVRELMVEYAEACGAFPWAPVKQQAASVPEGWREAVQKLVYGFEHVSGIARMWEPDHSSGADRAKWARATEACYDVAKMLSESTYQPAQVQK